jgi:hypothetical protein
MRIFLMLLLFLLPASASGQDYRWNRPSVVTGSAWSMVEGDEYLFLGLQIPLTNKLHTGLNYGYRPQEIKIQQIGTSLGFDLYTVGPHRLYAKTDLSFFYKASGLIWDDRYIRHSWGIGYTTQFYKRIVLLSEYNFIGFYYGTRKDYPQNPPHPSVFGAGEFKLGIGYKF